MEPAELDAYLEELDNRLERLRALYEQYFLGIEKIEPTIARKDVDRRFWMLRRLQIRNTARRFRLQVLVQRYNTFQQYWARICREIENGTYKRHLLKAEKRFGDAGPLTHAARRRLGKRARDTEEVERSASATKAAEDDLAELLGGSLDLEAEAERAAAQAVQPRPAPRRQAPAQLDDLDLDLDDGLDGPASVRRPPPVANRAAPPGSAVSPAAAHPGAARPVRPAPAAGAPSPAGASRPKPPVPTRATRDAGAALSPGGTPRASANVQRPSLPKPAAAGSASTDVSEARVRQLHAELTQAKKQLNQRGEVSVDGLAKTLRATAARLKTKHQGQVDFQVVVKDGQAVVRPVVRKPRR